MAISTFLISAPTFQIKQLLKDQSCPPLRSRFRLHGRHHRISHTCCNKAVVISAEFSSDPNKVKLQMNIVKQRLKKAVPDPVKEFPWKKAEDQIIRRMLSVGNKALKWCIVTLFISSFCSDVLFSISRNKELLIPFGLSVGCLMTAFSNETLQELFRDSQQEKGLSWRLVGIGCFFVLVKFISTYVAVQGHVFLLNFANGGLMQVLWLWKRLLEEEETGNAENVTLEPGL